MKLLKINIKQLFATLDLYPSIKSFNAIDRIDDISRQPPRIT